MTAASPIRLASPASIIEAVSYLLGFDPADSLVIVGLRNGQLERPDESVSGEDRDEVAVADRGDGQLVVTAADEHVERADDHGVLAHGGSGQESLEPSGARRPSVSSAGGFVGRVR